jgi:TetR/AcrR family transcriptional regulator, transcriptional repressor for nem operon
MTPVMVRSSENHDDRHAKEATRMREPNQRGAETRTRIVEAAGRLFREHGFDAVGVDAIMHAAGLTHGGFYTHFASKEALVAEAAADALTRSAGRWETLAREQPAAAALERIVASYLDPAHVAEPARGCLLAALGPEVARHPVARPGVTAAIRIMLGALARCVPGRRRARAAAAFCTLVGAVVLARASDDPALSAEFLTAARAAAGPSLRRPSLQ